MTKFIELAFDEPELPPTIYQLRNIESIKKQDDLNIEFKIINNSAITVGWSTYTGKTVFTKHFNTVKERDLYYDKIKEQLDVISLDEY